MEDFSIEEGWTGEKMLSASQMEAEELVNCFKESLKYDGNPLSRIFENEILRRLYILISRHLE